MQQKILLVDDNEDLLKITGLILKSQGYEVHTAGTVEEATLLIDLNKPALILLDVCICQEDGLLFCNQLKHDAATHNIKVILMSGYDYDKKDWNGADDFLYKPFDFATLTEKVATHLAPASLTARSA